MLKRYAELRPSERVNPCQEYPGEWLLCVPNSLLPHVGEEFKESHTSLEAARLAGHHLLNRLEDNKVEYNPRDISVCWNASDNDPRIGMVWFTGFYMHGRWDCFGRYRET